MNWLIRFGEWWESRRVLRKPDLEAFTKLVNRVEKKDLVQIPQTTAKELALLKARIDQLELYVGLKREPKPEHVPGAAKIS